MLNWDYKLELLAEFFNVSEEEMIHRCIDFRYGCLAWVDEFDGFVEDYMRDHYDSPVGINNQ